MPQPSEIVLLPFPFSDLSSTKLRPVLAQGDFLAAQITSQLHHAIQSALDNSDLVAGSLPKASVVRPDKLFSLNQSLVVRRVGQLSPAAFARVREAVCQAIGCAGAR
jgi:mRNA interferase MazF